MRPTTTLLKGALGSVFHAGDVARALMRRADVPAPPARPGHTIADIAHWYVPARTEYPANYSLKERTGFARIPLDETFRAQDQAPTSFS